MCAAICAEEAPPGPLRHMRMRGLEPPRPYGHTDLNRARLPIPPHPRGGGILAARRWVDRGERRRFGHACRNASPFPASHLTCSDGFPSSAGCCACSRSPRAHRPEPDPRQRARRGRSAPRAPSLAGSIRPPCTRGRACRSRAAPVRRALRAAVRSRPFAGATVSCSTARPSSSRVRRRRCFARCRASATVVGAALRAPLATSPQHIGAPAVGLPGSPTRGTGMKIAVIDDGVDQPPSVLLRPRVLDAGRVPQGPDRLHDSEGHRCARIRTGRTTWRYARRHSTRTSPSMERTSRASRRATPARSRRTPGIGCRATCVHRELQGAHGPDRRRRRSRRKRRRARRGDRGRRGRRNGRDQPVARGARGRAVTRSRRARTRRCSRAGVVPVVAAGTTSRSSATDRCRRPARRARDHRRRRHGPGRDGDQPRGLQPLGTDAPFTPAETRRERARRLDPLLAAGRLGVMSGTLDGEPAGRGRRRAPARASSTGRWPASQGRAGRTGDAVGSKRRSPRRPDARAAGSRLPRGRRPARARLARVRLVRPCRAGDRPDPTSDLADAGGGAGIWDVAVETCPPPRHAARRCPRPSTSPAHSISATVTAERPTATCPGSCG